MKKFKLYMNIRARLLAYFLVVAILPLFILAIASSIILNSNLNRKIEISPKYSVPYINSYDIENIKIQNRQLIFQITLIATITGVALAYLLAIYINKPLSEITNAAKEIENGDFTKHLNIETNDEFGFLAESFNNMSGALQKRKELEEFKEDFTATLTHDLRVPLLANVQTLEYFAKGSYGGLSENQNFIIEKMIENNRELLGMVNNILDSYKYDAGKQALLKSHANLNTIIEKSIDDIKSLADKKAQTIIFEPYDPIMTDAFVDTQEIKRVITNLLSNAITYTNENGTIKINTNKKEDHIIVSIEDNGVGLSQDAIKYIFERYSRASKKLKKIGTGLGLYLSKQIIQAHNGQIWVESAKDKGSIFYFSIPNEAES